MSGSDRESERIDSTGDLARESLEIHGGAEPPVPSKKPLISPVVKWILVADIAIAVVAVAVFMLV